jgi:GTPase SAR1 family protein
MQQVKITMIGPRRVGKTSLLTAMYQQLEDKNRLTNIQLTPDINTATYLGKRLAELKSLSDDFEEAFEEKGIQRTEAAAGSDSLRSFIFDLGKKGTKPSLQLHFQDYPGGYILHKDKDEQEFVKKLLTESVVVLIAIDAPSLMEAKGRWHQDRNSAMEITAWFKNVYQDIKSPRLVIFAPVKCESYMKNPKSANELLKRVKEEYANLLDLFSAEALRQKVAVVVTPVQTVGNVFFSYIEVINGKPHFFFSKNDHDAEYKPQDSEQPLKYLLCFLLKLHIQGQWGMLNFIRDWLGFDNEFKEIVRDYAKDCKTNSGFEIIQGKDWLNI